MALTHPYLPADIDDVQMSFPAETLDLIPAHQSIPKEYQLGNGEAHWGFRFFRDLFYVGIKVTKAIPKDGIDAEKALRHLSVIAGSYEPSHEHKTAAVAYLASVWFDCLEWEVMKS